MIGQRLGPYEVVSTLGEGGMGAVYRARDTRLKRDVAIKVLLPEVANDPERLARFQREAEVLATLNHPNIAHIYGLESREGQEGREGQDGREGLVGPFLVLELVEGPTLADRIAAMNGRGLPLDEALPIAKQIADALEAAHEEGIIHRDLKPANIKVKDNGTVKVLDFGLAKASERPGMPGGPGKPGVSGESGRPGLHALTQSPTLTSPALMTGVGMLLGTAAYMSPEQAKGRPADKRADIWAFGCVLYEMLTGQRAFPGEDVTDTIVSVLSKDADFSAISETVPARVTQTLKVCLRRDSKQRASDIRDVRLALEGAFESPMPVLSPAATPVSRGRSVWMAIGTTAVAALAIGAVSATWLTTKKTVTAEPRVFQIESGEGITAPKVSPDGRSVAFVKGGRVSVRALDTGKTLDLAGTEGASNPFWSPDSRTIAFFAQTAITGRTETRLFAVAANGGTIRTLAENAFAPFGGTWGANGIVFVRFEQGLWLVQDGSPARRFAAIDRSAGEQNLAFPSFLPGGAILAILARADSAVRSLVVVAEDRRITLLDLSNEAPAWPVMTDSQSVLFQRQGASSGLWKIDVTSDLSSVTGAPTPVLPNGSFPSVSIDGMLVALSGVQQGDRQLVWVDRAGRNPSRFGRPQATFGSPSVSPDGSTVAVRNAPLGAGANRSNVNAIWLHQLATSQRLPLGTNGGMSPVWSPDGGRIAFVGVTADREFGLFVVPSSGIGDPTVITKASADNNNSPTWSADGRSLVYSSEGDLWTVAVEAGATPRRLLEKASHPAISPDGHYLAFTSTTTGRSEVYVTTFPIPSSVWPVSGDGGRYPRWNPRGGELFFASGPNVQDDPNSHRDLSVVRFATAPAVKIGAPATLFDTFALGYRTNTGGFRGYEISPDGQRILVQTTGMSGTPTITAIQNLDAWLAREH